MNIRRHQELLDFWEYSHGFDSEDGAIMLTDENSSLKVCKHCGKVFVATRPNMEFCSPQCKNQYNVYKSRAKKNDVQE